MTPHLLVAYAYLLFIHYHLSINNELFIILVCLVTTHDDLLTWFQALYYLIILRILTADGDLAAISLLATLVEDEYPLTARHTIKRAFRDDYCLLRLSKLQIQIVGLTGSDIARAVALEDEIDAEPTVSHLWINLANLQEIMLAILVEGGSQAGFHSVDVVLIHLCLYLIIKIGRAHV